PVVLLLTPCSVGLQGAVFRITEQRERQRLVVRELLQLLHAVRRDTHHGVTRGAQRGQGVPEITCFLGASRRARSGVKVHNDAVFRLWEQFAQGDGRAVGGRQGELGSARSHLETRHQDNLHSSMTCPDYVAAATVESADASSLPCRRCC